MTSQLSPFLRRARRAGAAALLLVSLIGLGTYGPGPAGAAPTVTATIAAPPLAAPRTVAAPADAGDPHPGIIPAPNSGPRPQDEGERGGWLQSALFFILCGALVLIGLLIWRESRRKLARQRQVDPPAVPSQP